MGRFSIVIHSAYTVYFVEDSEGAINFDSVAACESWISNRGPAEGYVFTILDVENARVVPRPSADYATRAVSLRLELAELLKSNGQSYLLTYSHGEDGDKVDCSIDGNGIDLVGLLKTARTAMPGLKGVFSLAAHG